MRDAYIVSAVRTPGGRSKKGSFVQTRPEDLITHVMVAAIDRIGLDKSAVDDFILGCAFPEAEQGLNLGRIAPMMAGFPETTSGAVVNRFCASGLESIAQSAMRVMAGWSEITMAGGIECMGTVPMGGNLPRPHPIWSKEHPEDYISMGVTAENVAKRYNVSRADQDEFGYHSQMKAAEAKKKGLYTEIVPTPADKYTTMPDGTIKHEKVMIKDDDGIREDTTLEGLAKLKTPFAANGTVTAGNSSQTTEGAAASVIMSADALKKYGIKPIAKLVCYTTAGCRSDEMGVGPSVSIPKLLNKVNMKVSDIGLWEINEAFASQALYCLRKLGLDDKKLWTVDSDKRIININGGAIALGHPLGCTGSKLAATLLANMQRLGVKYGVEAMCIGGGMGAAALFELCD
ncbi:MAG: thiolase family protein [Deltaproteobacteria bacterium]|nr:thiolase family protein [Deltaproteobacteria bacterium]